MNSARAKACYNLSVNSVFCKFPSLVFDAPGELTCANISGQILMNIFLSSASIPVHKVSSPSLSTPKGNNGAYQVSLFCMISISNYIGSLGGILGEH